MYNSRTHKAVDFLLSFNGEQASIQPDTPPAHVPPSSTCDQAHPVQLGQPSLFTKVKTHGQPVILHEQQLPAFQKVLCPCDAEGARKRTYTLVWSQAPQIGIGLFFPLESGEMQFPLDLRASKPQGSSCLHFPI